MRTRILLLVALFVAVPALNVFADDAVADAGAEAAGSAAAPAPTAAPSDSLHDPLSAPAATFDDVKAAKKVGWSVAVLAILVIACRLAARAGGVFSVLGKGKVALVIGAAGALSVSAYNAIASGGSWMAALLAAIVAGAAYWDSHAKAAEPKA